MMTAKDSKIAQPSEEEIRHQLESMLACPDFTATPQQVALLRYVVVQTLAGKANSIKGYTIATEVFGRKTDFDQNIDPIVSIQAGRLRRALTRYYEGAGKNDPLRIEIPKGSYVPTFETRPPLRAVVAERGTQQTLTGAKAQRYWPTVLVRPVHNVSGDPELETWGIGLAAELADELNRYPDVRVMTPGLDDMVRARFFIDGSVRTDSDGIKLIMNLTDLLNGRQIWSSSCRSATDNDSIIAFQERVARAVAVKLAGKRGVIAKTVGPEFGNGRPPGSEAYEAVIRFYEFRSSGTPASFQVALTALERAAEVDPECGQVWTLRARLFALIHALGIPGFDRPLEQALAFALKGLRLMPGDQRAHSVLAFIHMLRNDLAAARAEADLAIQFGPDTLFILDGIGYLLTLMGDWERGPAMIEKMIRANPYYGNYVHYALWLNWLRQGDYDRAYQETMKLNRPADFWDHLVKAATLGLLERIEDGRRSAAALLERKPDFPENGRRLIGHFIKFDDLADRVVEGLAAVGVKVQ